MIITCPTCDSPVNVPNRYPVLCKCGTRFYMEIAAPDPIKNPYLPVMLWGFKALAVILLALWVLSKLFLK